MILHNIFPTVLVLILFSINTTTAQGAGKQHKKEVGTDSLRSRKIEFRFEGKTYRGILDVPKTNAKSLMILVPGHGRTRVSSGKWNLELRKTLSNIGIATFAYDKAGCGDSDGTYDNNQPIENSADEITAAIEQLKHLKIPGSDNIGLWGISRAGWINPIVIKNNANIAYWVSVSGPNHLQNMSYLLRTNWGISGKSEAEINRLHSEWQKGFEIQYTGGTYQEYVGATPSLGNDDFIKSIRGGEYTEKRFLSYQEYLLEHPPKFDPETNVQIALEGFGEDYLGKINVPVLAIFGEKDSQVNWQKTKQLYERNIEDLTVITLPNCNHAIQNSNTGGFHETNMLFKKNGYEPNCDNYVSTIESWLLHNNFGIE